MAKAILTTKVEPSYEDQPEIRYHFPRTYLRQVEAAVGDWIVYYEPRRGGRQVYFATAKIQSISPHPTIPEHFFAYIEAGSYLDFSYEVPFREGDHYYESVLRKEDGSTNKGAFGRSVRLLPDKEYDLLLAAGFASVIGGRGPSPSTTAGAIPARLILGVNEEGAEFERPITERIVARPFRDRAFATNVVNAYDKRCAITGLQIINGGGRAEVQAAHIRAVEDGGSDSIRNGVALSGTVHWMFDRGLIAIDDDYSILVAEDHLPDAAKKLIRADKKLLLPAREDIHPHKSYLQYHRAHRFKG